MCEHVFSDGICEYCDEETPKPTLREIFGWDVEVIRVAPIKVKKTAFEQGILVFGNNPKCKDTTVFGWAKWIGDGEVMV